MRLTNARIHVSSEPHLEHTASIAATIVASVAQNETAYR